MAVAASASRDYSHRTMKTKCDVAVWLKLDDPDQGYYAFPLGSEDGLKAPAPLIEWRTWEFKGVLPKGQPVKDVRKDVGNRVRCTISGKPMFTGDWAVVED